MEEASRSVIECVVGGLKSLPHRPKVMPVSSPVKRDINLTTIVIPVLPVHFLLNQPPKEVSNAGMGKVEMFVRGS